MESERPDEGSKKATPRWRERLTALVERFTEHPFVVRVKAVVEISNNAGAPLLAAALAFNTMFALLPGLLLLSGILGWLIDDPVARGQLLADLVARIPPLSQAIKDSLEGVVSARGGLTIVGLVGLLWGASNFYAALDEVMRRIFAGGAVRGFVDQRVRGVIAVVGLVALAIGTVLLTGLWTALTQAIGDVGGLLVLSFVGPLVFVAGSVVAVLVVYLFVPTAPPDLRAALPAAILAGLGIGLLTSVFSVLAPILVGGLSAFGVLATLFGAFVWLNLCFQVLLWGAAWARYRRDRFRLVSTTHDF